MSDDERSKTYAKYGITRPSILGEEPISGIGWLRECRDALPRTPGMVTLGIRDDVVLIKLAEDSIHALVNGLLDDRDYYKRFRNVSKDVTAGLNHDLPLLWIAWTNYVFTDE